MHCYMYKYMYMYVCMLLKTGGCYVALAPHIMSIITMYSTTSLSFMCYSCGIASIQARPDQAVFQGAILLCPYMVNGLQS